MRSIRRAAEALKKVAPSAASAIAGGGPVGRLIEGMVADRLGVDPTPAAIKAAVVADPEAAAKLAGIEVEIQRSRLEDVQHARDAHRGHWMPPVLTILLLALMAGFLAALLMIEIPEANQRLADTAFGALLGAFSTAIAYWLGSSRGSADKQASLAAVIERR